MILTRIINEKRLEVEESKKNLALEKLLEIISKGRIEPRRNFKNSITKNHHIHLIAEIKKASPSCGVLREDFDPVKIAQVYEANKAESISILTDGKFFQGKLSYISRVREVTTIPILRKDFIIDEYQLYESFIAGADAVLLISDILSEEELTSFLSIVNRLNMSGVVEVHSEWDLEKALKVGSPILGINNRDLHTFKVDINTTSRLIRLIPKGKVVIAESGITSYEKVMFLKSLGVDAVLIGEAFMRSPDIGAKVKEVMGY